MSKVYSTLISDNIEVIDEINLIDGCNAFILFQNVYDESNNLVKSIFDIIEEMKNRGFSFINNILVPLRTNSEISDNVLYIGWFSNNLKSYFADKDPIREKSIWKDVEWGKREKNYNKKGKDPGNVWIPTVDDGKGKITDHILLNVKEVLYKLIKFSTRLRDNVLVSLDIEENEIVGLDDFVVDLYKFNNSVKFKSTPIKFDIIQNISVDRLEANVYFESSENMNKIEDSSISCMVTSPPYWNIKDYFKDGQIGQESYEQYINRLTKVWKQCYDKLTDSGTFWININTISKNKTLIPIPADIIKSCKKIGLYFKLILIWHKSSAIPTSDRNLSDHFEYVLVFSKSPSLHLNTEGLTLMQDYKNSEINHGLFWNINRKAGIIGKNYVHPAVFPVKLIERIITISTSKFEKTLDPFLGSGTSLIASLNVERSFIGYEFNEDFLDLIKYRVENESHPSLVNYNGISSDNAINKVFRNE